MKKKKILRIKDSFFNLNALSKKQPRNERVRTALAQQYYCQWQSTEVTAAAAAIIVIDHARMEQRILSGWVFLYK